MCNRTSICSPIADCVSLSQQVVNPNTDYFHLLDTMSIIVNDPADISTEQSERVKAIAAQVTQYLTTLYTSAYYRNLLLRDKPGKGLIQDSPIPGRTNDPNATVNPLLTNISGEVSGALETQFAPSASP